MNNEKKQGWFDSWEYIFANISEGTAFLLQDRVVQSWVKITQGRSGSCPELVRNLNLIWILKGSLRLLFIQNIFLILIT